MENHTPPTQRWLKWPSLRLSIRAMMALILLLGGGLGWVIHRARVQRLAVEAVRRTGGGVAYDFQRVPGKPNNNRAEPNAPKWLVDRLGVDYFGDVVQVLLLPKATDAEMAHVGRLPKLRSFNATTASEITDAGAAHLAGLVDLERINLSGTKVTGAALANFRGMSQLKGLSVIALRISDADLAQLEGLTGLESLFLSSTQVTDAGLAHLAGLVNLKQLWLNSTQITGPGLVHLKGMTKLEGLLLDGSKLRDLDSLPPLPALKDLRLGETSVGDAHLAALTRLPSLNSLTLRGTGITDAGLVHLVGLNGSLRTLFLGQTQITDASAPTLLRLDKLEILNLDETKVTDATTDQLGQLTSLRSLRVNKTGVTDAGLARLKKALPLLNTPRAAPNPPAAANRPQRKAAPNP